MLEQHFHCGRSKIMALRKKGDYYYGDSQDDLSLGLKRYAKNNKYPIDDLEVLVCRKCGGNVFVLFQDDEESGALCQCVNCAENHFIRDSQEYIDQDEMYILECLCGNKDLQITTGVSFYKGTKDARWVYVGGYCSKCGVLGSYIDWNER
jgi:hypothetical protein